MKYAIFTNEKQESLMICQEIISRCQLVYTESLPDYVVIIGGDGTVLRAIQHYMERIDHIIFFAFNTGNLGFYTNYQRNDLDLLIQHLNEETFQIEAHYLLQYEVEGDGKVLCGFALNEVTLMNSPNVVILDIFIDQLKLETFRGTGICVSTPTGSTAYNKSLGGAVIDYGLPSLQLAEIASINSNAYRTLGSPIVLSQSRKITFTSCLEGPILFTADNHCVRIQEFSKLNTSFSNHCVKFGLEKPVHFINRVKKGFI